MESATLRVVPRWDAPSESIPPSISSRKSSLTFERFTHRLFWNFSSLGCRVMTFIRHLYCDCCLWNDALILGPWGKAFIGPFVLLRYYMSALPTLSMVHLLTASGEHSCEGHDRNKEH